VKKRRRKGVTVSDRMLALAGPVRPVSGSSRAWSRSSDRTLHSKSDRTPRARVRSQVTHVDVGGAGVDARAQS
jgi:hypothetical protein